MYKTTLRTVMKCLSGVVDLQQVEANSTSNAARITNIRNWLSASSERLKRLPEDLLMALLKSFAVTTLVQFGRMYTARQGLADSANFTLSCYSPNIAVQTVLQILMLLPSSRRTTINLMVASNQAIAQMAFSSAAYLKYLGFCICVQTFAQAWLLWRSFCVLDSELT